MTELNERVLANIQPGIEVEHPGEKVVDPLTLLSTEELFDRASDEDFEISDALKFELEERMGEERYAIDGLNKQLGAVLTERGRHTNQIGLIKAILNKSATDIRRERESIDNLRTIFGKSTTHVLQTVMDDVKQHTNALKMRLATEKRRKTEERERAEANDALLAGQSALRLTED